MTRAEAKQFLINLGIADPTEENITSYLNSVNGEVQKEKDKSKSYKEKADTADELQKKLDEIEAGNLSEIEKIKKELEKANQTNADLLKKDAIRSQREQAMSNFKISSEQAKEVVNDDGTLNYEALGKIISDKETASANAKEKAIADGASNPNGGSSATKADEKTESEIVAENIGKQLASSNADAKSVVDTYL